MQRENKPRRARLAWYETLAFAAFAGVFLISAFMLIQYFVGASREQGEFDQLAAAVRPSAAASSGAQPDGQEQTGGVELDALFEQNSDLFGWITIPDTAVDYPVMHTPDVPQKYLRRNFYGEYSLSGVPFLEATCTSDSSNLIVYGHNMKSGIMFHDLENYLDAAYCAAHPTISLTTAEGETLYDVVAALHFQVTEQTVAAYYAVPQTKEAFDAYVEALRAASAYEVYMDVEWGSQLLTLSTCDNITDDGRILVIARAQ